MRAGDRRVDAAEVSESRRRGPRRRVAHQRGGALYVTTDGERFTPVRPPGGPSWGYDLPTFAVDSARAVVLGPCAARERERGPTDTVCVYDGRRRWAPRRLAGRAPARWQVGGLRGDSLLLGTIDPGVETLSLAWSIFDLRTGRATPLEAPEGYRWIDRVRWTPDGTLFGIVERGSGRAPESAVALRAPGGAWRVSALPERGLGVGFADAERGFVRGVERGQLWRTVNGGATWEPFPVPGGRRGRAAISDFACDGRGCSFGDALHVLGWGALTDAQRAAAAAPGEAPRPSDRPHALFRPAVALTCGSGGVARPSPWRSLGPEVYLPLTGDAVTMERGADGVHVAWDSLEQISGSAVIAPERRDPRELAIWGDRTTYDVFGAHVGALVVAHSMPHDRLLWARGATTRSLADALPAVERWSLDTDGWLVVRERSGGLAVAVTGGGVRRAGAGFVVDGDGGVRSARRVVLEGADDVLAEVGLLRRGDRWSLAWRAGEESLAVAPFDGGPTERLPLPAGPFSVCAAPPPPDVPVLIVRTRRSDTHGLMFNGHGIEARVLFALGPGRPCVFGAQLRNPAPQEGLSRMQTFGEYVTLSAARDALVGFVDDTRVRGMLRCEVGAPREAP
jgi:hypothetical protein